MVPAFPNYIFINDDGLSRAEIENVRRSEMEVGPSKQRPIQCKSMFNLRFSVSICDDDLSSFYEWFHGDIKSGAFWFLLKDPIDGIEKRFRFVNKELNFQKRGQIYTTDFQLEAYNA